MSRRIPTIVALALLVPVAGCESNGGGSSSVGFYGSYGYYSGYYPGYGYWYDDNDVVIPSDRVSRYHARVYVEGRRVEIEDLDSMNGTEVNEERIQRCRLRPGDRILLAKEVELEYRR